MRKKVAISLVLISFVLLSSQVSAIEMNEIEPKIYECPASSDGKHHYNIEKGVFHMRIGTSDRCEVFSSSRHTCTACGDVFTTPKYDIREHEYGSTRCKEAGAFKEPPWDY